MLIRRLPIDQLNPAPYNPRRLLKPGDAAWIKLERSLAEFDLVQPIVWNTRSGHVVSGHQRMRVLKHRGATDVDCVVVDLSPEREKALNVTLNNAAVGSDWDADKLVNLLDELQLLPDFDATLTGFDDQQLADLLLAPDDAQARTADDPEGASGECLAVTLEIPRDCWASVRARLDDLLAAEPAVRLHRRIEG